MPTLDQLVHLLDVVGDRLRVEPVDRHTLLEMATVLMLLSPGLGETVASRVEDPARLTEARGLLLVMEDGLMWVRSRRDTALVVDLRAHLLLSHAAASRLIGALGTEAY